MIERSSNVRAALRARQRGFLLDPFRFGGGGGGGTDPNISDVSALLHMDGANGSGTFTDHSQYAATYTQGAGAVISTAQSMFGGASGRFDGTANNGVNVSANGQITSGDHYITAGDFTVEWWHRPVTLTGGVDWNAFSVRNSAANVLMAFCGSNSAPNDIRFVIRNASNSSNVDISAVVAGFVINTWFHIACVADGSTARIYVGGVQVASGAISGTRSITDARFLQIGNFQSGTLNRAVDAYLDDFRVTRMCRYPNGTTFSVPSAAFPNS